MPLTRPQLDAQGCDTPDCGHDHSILYLHAACHPGAGVDVSYVKADGMLHVVCHKCDKPVGLIAVADEVTQ